jgi:ATP-dependent RNA helicase RhlE
MTFEELNLRPELLAAVRDQGYDRPTPIQELAIPHALAGKDVLGRAQTGTGKTAAFMLPLLQKLAGGDGLRALVLCPTRELAMQVAESGREYARHLDLWVGLLYGGVPVKDDLRDLRAGYDVIVATPGRLNDHLERGNVDFSQLEVLVLDEADRMLDMGFKPQIDQILRRCPKERQTLFFSATLPNAVKSLAYEILKDPVSVEVTPKVVTADRVEQWVYPVLEEKKFHLLLELLARPDHDSVLVFTRTKFGADRLAKQLDRAGIEAAVMHGDRDMKQRTRALESFREGERRILVATDVAQRGLDVDGITHVINYDTPQDPDGYIHRVGRTARAGESGVAITFVTIGELGDLKAIEYLLGREIPRMVHPEYGYGAGDGGRETKQAARSTRGRRLGSRQGAELTAEELGKLLQQG